MTGKARKEHRYGFSVLLIVLVVLLSACAESAPRYDLDAGRTPPVTLSASSGPGYFAQPTFEVRPDDNNTRSDPVPHLVVSVSMEDGFELAELGIYYQLLHFKGNEKLTEAQYDAVNTAVAAVLRGEGTGLTRDYSAPTNGTVELALPLTMFNELDAHPAEYVVVWGIQVTEARGEDTVNAAIGGSFVYDGNQVYSLALPDGQT